MKYIWQQEDIQAGIYVSRNFPGDKLITSNWAGVTYKLGFCAARNHDRYCLIAMTDGMICDYLTKAEMADYLNKENFMPCHHDKLIDIINYMRK